MCCADRSSLGLFIYIYTCACVLRLKLGESGALSTYVACCMYVQPARDRKWRKGEGGGGRKRVDLSLLLFFFLSGLALHLHPGRRRGEEQRCADEPEPGSETAKRSRGMSSTQYDYLFKYIIIGDIGNRGWFHSGRAAQ